MKIRILEEIKAEYKEDYEGTISITIPIGTEIEVAIVEVDPPVSLKEHKE